MRKDASRCESLANACNISLYEDALNNGIADPVRAFIFWEQKGVFHLNKWTEDDINQYKTGEIDFPTEIKLEIDKALRHQGGQIGYQFFETISGRIKAHAI